MYVAQAPFYNAVAEVATSLSPLELLDFLQDIERDAGRVTKGTWGPRVLDLDVVLGEGQEWVVDESQTEGRLGVPHGRMLEREFVLRPLCDLIPDACHPTLDTHITFRQHLDRVADKANPMSTITPICDSLPPLKALDPTRRTHVMAIVNVTPDSFSDGGMHMSQEITSLAATLESHRQNGASIIDIGGQSTRPGAAPVTAAEELSRILPCLEAYKTLTPPSDSNSRPVLPAISIDTYRASVAAAAIRAGAHIINDVSAGTLDPDMLPTLAQLDCPVILMHMRGDPTTMSTAAHTSYPDGLIATIARELRERIEAAERAGIPRWRIMLDPGIGFAKTAEQNVECLARMPELRAAKGLEGFGWVVGTSRKGFLGKLTGRVVDERVWGSAGAVAVSVWGGADVVRVHDVAAMRDVVKVADAVWRR